MSLDSQPPDNSCKEVTNSSNDYPSTSPCVKHLCLTKIALTRDAILIKFFNYFVKHYGVSLWFKYKSVAYLPTLLVYPMQ